MKSFWKISVIGLAISTGLAMVACSKGFQPLKRNSVATPAAQPSNNNQQMLAGGNTVAAKTEFKIINKDVEGAKDSAVITVLLSDGNTLSFSGVIDIDDATPNVSTQEVFFSDGGQTNDALVYKSVLPSGDMIILVSYDQTSNSAKPDMIIFSGKAGSSEVALLKDQTFVPSLGLEALTNMTTIQVRDALENWLRLYGANGLDTFAQQFNNIRI